jgi:hypothetical protein
VLTTGCCDGVEAGAWLGAGLERCVVVVVRECDRAEGAGSGDGVVTGAFCGLGPAARAGVIGTAADAATTAAVRLILVHRAMVHGNARC